MPKKILLIEDHVATAEAMLAYLKLRGFEVVVAYDGPSGLEKAAAEMPDLILLDVMMQGMSGIEVCERLANDPKTSKIPIVIVSVKAAAEDVRTGKEAGAEDYVIKPFDPKKLLKVIKNILKE